jgi:hypothetical protein
MANRNEPLYLKKFLEEYPIDKWIESLSNGRILNAGAADYGTKIFFDAIFKGRPVVGVDIEKKPGVNLICDLEGDCLELNDEKFSLILCCSLLELVKNPFIVAQNLERHLLPFGLLYVTIPWIWRTHEYPKDYWRISVDGIKVLFPHVVWKRIAYSTLKENEFIDYNLDHDQQEPWRILWHGRMYIAVQMIHMIGRLS